MKALAIKLLYLAIHIATGTMDLISKLLCWFIFFSLHCCWCRTYFRFFVGFYASFSGGKYGHIE